jgi:protein-tyrosine-phosphatase
VTYPADARVANPRLPRVTVADPLAKRMRTVLKAVYHSVLNLPDRLLHPRRHYVVCRRLSRMRRPRSILVVCHGNVCRSPYLHAVLQRAFSDVAVSSAGFIGRDRAVPGLSLEVSARRGIDLSRFRSRVLTLANVQWADLIIVMDAGQARYVERVFLVRPEKVVVAGDLDPEASPTRAIRDPWMQSVNVFESSFDRLDRCAATLVSVLNGAPGAEHGTAE